MNKLQTKYDCPSYKSDGGHCKKKSYKRNGVHIEFGCKYPNDISKCPFVKKAIEDSLFLKG